MALTSRNINQGLTDIAVATVIGTISKQKVLPESGLGDVDFV